MADLITGNIQSYEFDVNKARFITNRKLSQKTSIIDFIYEIKRACLQGKRECYLYYPSEEELEEIKRRGFAIEKIEVNNKTYYKAVW